MLDQSWPFIPQKAKNIALIGSIDEKRLPRHVAIIMDGNGRWAKQKDLDQQRRPQRRRRDGARASPKSPPAWASST